jgi:4-amino-4-deoxy-L-arabinose transferase-like glycosyltransferase
MLRFWRLGAVALIGDESYYWLWSERPAPAYFDNAAGVAFLVRASTALAGQSERGIRWLNAALGVGAVYLSYVLGTQLCSRRAGAIGAAFLAVGAPYLVVSRFVYTDALQIFLLLLSLVLLAPLIAHRWEEWAGRHARGRETWRFWAIGLSMAALLNTKYNAYLYAAVVLVVLLVRRRTLFREPRTWLAMGIAACGLAPVLVWNAQRDWASFRWQFQHFGAGTIFRSTVQANLMHAIRYLTPTLALAGVLGLSQVRELRRQLLLAPALALTLPILLGPTDSPRNLLTGLALLLVLAGDAFDRWIARSSRLAWSALGLCLLGASVYGVGTVIETMAPSVLPSSTIGSAIRVDGAGWRTVGLEFEDEAEVFALDYSIASQLRYYTGRPVHTAWAQYQLWGIPALCGPYGTDVQIVALGYVEPQFVTQRLIESFDQVEGPVELAMGEGKVLYTWTAHSCTIDQVTFLERFDFLTLVEAGGRR